MKSIFKYEKPFKESGFFNVGKTLYDTIAYCALCMVAIISIWGLVDTFRASRKVKKIQEGFEKRKSMMDDILCDEPDDEPGLGKCCDPSDAQRYKSRLDVNAVKEGGALE